jgi:hypothetical protein
MQVNAIPQSFFPGGGRVISIQSTVTDSSVVIQSEDATIVDGTGAVIKDLSPPYITQGVSQLRYWYWDGTDGGGSVVAPGAYTAVVLVKSADGRTGIGTLPITVQAG